MKEDGERRLVKWLGLGIRKRGKRKNVNVK
jgi:hypothetical protein